MILQGFYGCFTSLYANAYISTAGDTSGAARPVGGSGPSLDQCTRLAIDTGLPLCSAASIARKVYMRQDIGVGAFRKQYGGRNKRRGTVPEHYVRASGGIIRHILKQLEVVDVVEKSTTLKGGRRITPHGQRDLDLIAAGIAGIVEEDEDEEEAEE